MASRPPDPYVLEGREAILELLGDEHAVVRREIEAKIADKVWTGLAYPIYPHNLTTALRALEEAGQIAYSKDTTKGQREIETIHLANPRQRQILTKVDRAAARKRMLYGRYRSWSDPTGQYPQGFLGPAGERVVRASFRAVADRGFTPVSQHGGEVTRLLGVELQGPLDDALYLTVEAAGLPTVVTLPVEVKNIRQWVYPGYHGLFQLLHKAAVLQRQNPDQLICPVLVCRRRQYKTLAMAIDLGFYAISARAQYLLPLTRISVRHLEEVRRELGFEDLRKQDGSHDRLAEKFIGRSLRGDALDAARRWADTAPDLVDAFDLLRDRSLSYSGRRAAMAALREHIAALPPRDNWEDYPDHRGIW